MGVHIVLFLKTNLQIDFSLLIDKMKESYKEIGNGIIIPSDSNQKPNFIFKENKDILIDGNNHHISINIFNEYTSIQEDIIEMLYDAFDYCDLEFIRVGYIKEYEKDIKDISGIKNLIFKPHIVESADEFQIAYHSNIKFKKKNINCWKRFTKFYNTPLIIGYDINTKEENIKEVNYKLLKEFLQFASTYIDEDINLLLKEKEQ